MGSIQANQAVLTRWKGQRVHVTGFVYGAPDDEGCGHFNAYPCQIVPYSIERR